MNIRWLIAGASALVLPSLLFTSVADAKSQAELPWSPRDVFNVAVRFVRVDRGCKITDKDADSAYVLFECEDGKAVKHGALELIPAEVQGRSGVRAQVTLSDDPRYIELRFLELLERKMKDERGPALPPRNAPPASPNPPTDAGR